MPTDELDWDLLADTALALLALTLHDHGRAWKQFSWDLTDLLHDKGYLENPKGKAKSVVLTEAGEERALRLLRERFTRAGARDPGE